MAKEIVGTGYYEIKADFTKINQQMAAFQNQMASKKFTAGMQGMNAELDKASKSVGKVGTKAVESFGSAIKSALSLERIINRLAFIGTVGAVYTLGRAIQTSIGDGIEKFQEFDKSMRHVWTVMESGIDVVNEFGRAVREIAIVNLQDLKETASSLYDIMSSQIPEEDAIYVLAQSAELAEANMAGLRNVTNTVLSIIKAYGLNASEAEHITDMLQKTIKVGRMEMTDFSASFGKIVTPASNFGFKIEEILAILASMTQKGMNARESVTSLRRAIMAWSENSELMRVKEKLGIKGIVDLLALQDDQTRKTMSGGIRGVQALISYYADYEGQLNAVNEILDNNGAKDESLAKQRTASARKIELSEQRVIDRLVDIGDELQKLALGWQYFKEAAVFSLEYVITDMNRLINVFNPSNNIINKIKEIFADAGSMPSTKLADDQTNSTKRYVSALSDAGKESAKLKQTEEERLAAINDTTQAFTDQYRGIIENADNVIKLLGIRLQTEKKLGNDTADIKNSLRIALQGEIEAYQKLIDAGDTLNKTYEDMLNAKLALAKLDAPEYNSLDKLVMKMLDSSYEYGARLSDIRDVIDKLLTGGKIALSTGSTWQMNSLLEEFYGFGNDITLSSFKESISTSREAWQEFYDWLLENYINIAEQFKKVNPKPPVAEMTDFAKAMEKLSGAFEKNNKIADFVRNMKELDAELGSGNVVKFLKGEGISDKASSIFKKYGIELEDLKAKLEELDISAETFFDMFADEGKINKIKAFADRVGEIVDGMADSFSDFISNETAEWARMIGAGENATKSFGDFWDRFLAGMLSAFTKMVTKMIIQWALFQAFAIGTNPFTGATSGGGSFFGMLESAGAGDIGINQNMNIPDNLINAINRTPSINTQSVINLYPTFDAKFDRRSSGWVVRQGNQYNNMVEA